MLFIRCVCFTVVNKCFVWQRYALKVWVATMELRHLRYFVAVAEEGSLTNAAERRLHTAQPSLSRQIRDLELEIGVKLLERKARGTVLTAAGRVFLDHARRRERTATALMHADHLGLWVAQHVVDPQGARIFDHTVDSYRPLIPIESRNAEVAQHKDVLHARFKVLHLVRWKRISLEGTLRIEPHRIQARLLNLRMVFDRSTVDANDV